MSTVWLRAAVEILTMPGGPSDDSVQIAIEALQYHLVAVQSERERPEPAPKQPENAQRS